MWIHINMKNDNSINMMKIFGFLVEKNVKDHRLDNRMESFSLAETIKYLYLIFDEKNFLHSNGEYATEHQTSSGQLNCHISPSHPSLSRVLLSSYELSLQYQTSSNRYWCLRLLFIHSILSRKMHEKFRRATQTILSR